MKTEFHKSWTTQGLADFLAGINQPGTESEIFSTATEMAADALDCELAAVLGPNGPAAVFGAADWSVIADQVDAALAGQHQLVIDGAGPCSVVETRIPQLDYRLVLARRQQEEFSAGERVLMRSMARALGMAVTTRRLMTTTKEQQRTLAAVIESALDCIISMDADGIVQEWNPAAEKTFGYMRDEAIGRTLSELVIPPEARSRHEEGLRRYLEKGHGSMIDQRVEMLALHQSGARFPVEVAITELPGDRPFFTAYLRDISDRKEATRTLTEMTDQLTALVESLNAGVIVETEDRRVALVNARACEVFGTTCRPEDVRGIPWNSLADELAHLIDDFDQFNTRTNAIFGAGLPTYDDEVRLADGRVLARDHIPIAGRGAQRGRLWVYRDITARIEFEQDLEEARDKALAASRLKSSFLATMSHEIRTPMNGVVGLVDLLRTSDLDPEQGDLVAMLGRSAEHLMGVIDDILDFSRIEAGELLVESIPFAPRTIIEDVARLFEPRAQSKGVDLSAHIGPDLEGLFLSDPGRIRQILQNLVGNAVKFTDEGSVAVRAAVQSSPDFPTPSQLCVSVTDTGVGIGDDALAYLFEPFVQGDASTSRLHGGSGLGLSICHRLAGLLGGRLEVTSTPGVGSTFTVTLPLIAAPIGQGAEDMLLLHEAPHIDARILVVEDNPVNQTVVTLQLQRLGYEVEVVSGGEQALDALRYDTEFDAILMDCQMPGMDGFAATAYIRALDGPEAGLPIIAMTANALREDRDACLNAGMDDYLAKPVRTEDLDRTLQRWISANRQRGPLAQPPEKFALIDESVIDGLITDLGDDPEVVTEFTDLFLQELPARLDALQAHLQARHADGIRQAAHALRSPSRALGLDRLGEICERMEHAARDGEVETACGLERNLLAASADTVEALSALLMRVVAPTVREPATGPAAR